ncbi:MAG: hypothetical protein UR81_C0006G0002 [Candidatus Levybacteria bacterium GW2011_GWB1_35_5]|nr:MAG: hypothetical protein UR81_C0006G0002 [Candidatus Levybacteria bacterium GW2011_GWB1_35_5]
MKKSVLLIFVLVLTVSVLSVIRTYVSNNIATSGVTLSLIEEEVASLKTENAVLSQKLYESSSLTNVASKASVLGFVDSQTSFVLNSGLPVAKR